MKIDITAARKPLTAALIAFAAAGGMQAQVSAYTFGQSLGTFQPLNGTGTMIGYAMVDDEVFVNQGDLLGFGLLNSGNGWPIGFIFHFNGIAFDRVGLSTEGWLSFGRSSFGGQAVYMPIGGAPAYSPLSAELQEFVDVTMRNRVVAFGNDLRARQGIWPLQIRTSGSAPDRTCIIEWNVSSSNTAANGSFAFQVHLLEGGGDPAQQVVKVVYGAMSASGNYTGQVGLGGATSTDFNNREVTVSPYDWAASTAGTLNSATCRIPSGSAQLPAGLTYTWTPPACAVAGVSITGLASDGTTASGTLSWHAVTGATNYAYVITAGGPADPPVASGTGITGTSVVVNDLPLGTELFAYVRAACSPTADWSTPHAFTTASVVSVPCGAPALQQEYCYVHYDQRTWRYTSSEGSPVRLVFHAGDLSVGDVLVCYDGPDASATVLFTTASGAEIAGQTVTSTGSDLFMKLISDGVGSCEDLEFIPPLEWEVGCLDCEPVLASYEVELDCDNDRFFVNVQLFSMGTASVVEITNDGGAPAVQATAIGTHTVGPFPLGTPVIVQAENTENPFCTSMSTPQVNPPCAVVSCGPDTYTYCYTDSDESQWLYRAEGGERIGIRFIHGSLAPGDAIRFYDGEDVFSTVLHSVTGGDLSGLFVSSSSSSNTILLEVISDGSGSCATGQAGSWEYVVECHHGCEPPEATYTVVDDCANEQFSVLVSVTSLGTASSLALTNDGGAPAVTVNATGSYTVGPFDLDAPVVVGLEGDGAVCSTNSPLLIGCGVGMDEFEMNVVKVYPNPANDVLQLVLPNGFGGYIGMEVLDLAGRRVAADVLQVHGGLSAPVDLGHLPAGSYVVIVGGDRRLKGKVLLLH